MDHPTGSRVCIQNEKGNLVTGRVLERIEDKHFRFGPDDEDAPATIYSDKDIVEVLEVAPIPEHIDLA